MGSPLDTALPEVFRIAPSGREDADSGHTA